MLIISQSIPFLPQNEKETKIKAVNIIDIIQIILLLLDIKVATITQSIELKNNILLFFISNLLCQNVHQSISAVNLKVNDIHIMRMHLVIKLNLS